LAMSAEKSCAHAGAAAMHAITPINHSFFIDRSLLIAPE
jgi:hypothetical protein